ncbi:SUKH-4 family immunity protein [Streptomyces sp. NPDC002851]
MPALREEDWELVQAWLGQPRAKTQVFSVTGPAGSGKTAFLEAVRYRLPGSALIDCTGLSADEVATRMRRACLDLPDGEPVVLLLANVQYAGELPTSTEPSRIVHPVAWRLRRVGKRQVWVMIERDPARVPAPRPNDYDITLPIGTTPLPDTETEQLDPRLTALAAAEQRAVPPEVWRLLCSAAGTETTAAELLALAGDRTDVRITAGGDGGTAGPVLVGFLDDTVLHNWRRRTPWGPAEQARTVDALVAACRELPHTAWEQLGPVAQYACRTLAVHAALAGVLSRVLDDGRLLAQCAPSGLHTALALAYPDGVPYATVPALVRYLEAQGVEAATQGEWVAWLHHAALTEGRAELAAQLLDSGVPLPWRTEWTRCRPMGVFGLRSQASGRVDVLGITKDADGPNGPSVITARDITRNRHSYPIHKYLRQEWDAESGTSSSAPVSVSEPLAEGGWPWYSAEHEPRDGSAVFARNVDGTWQSETVRTGPLPPRCPAPVTDAVRLESDRGRWVLAGRPGIFGIRVLDENLPEHPEPFPVKPVVAPHTTAALWPLPERAAAALRGEGLRDWFEETFGEGSCHRLDPDQLPAGLIHRGARRFLTDTGLPDIRSLLHLGITPPSGGRALVEVPWPSTGPDAPWRQQAKVEAPTSGPFYELGHWMYSRLLLDGATGQLWRDTTGGMHEPLAGSSLSQFFAMVRLFDEFRRVHFPYDIDHQDARASLTAWCEQIDGPAARGEVWANILEGYEFEDSTWDLAAYGDDIV